MKLDPRQFSQEAYGALESLSQQLNKKYHKKASALVQGLPAYISTWGLHRLSGDAKSFSGKNSEDTKYKGTVYYHFLESLQKFSGADFQPRDEKSLIFNTEMPLRDYLALNHLALRFAKEWSFWAASLLGEAENN
ncbi:type III-B CRISPR module-associated protein Cmr5 [Nodosilinea sp. E11]|uniref:type III-B CRISPR module-associated protein Cmr5 n=1 Tax=Nodosilinea sp. E11 TaxID=3037479 RepID=UPI0029346651|nr:type III-B CRISPR module-associated protein Cmr5 [Nodosilinea sp. E11]WOD37197.1 type III-B CRISPR module-associated protein Cmr5 [Nodosilinea sp. E11]